MDDKYEMSARLTAIEMALIAVIETTADPAKLLAVIDRIDMKSRPADEPPEAQAALTAALEIFRKKCNIMQSPARAEASAQDSPPTTA